jgi:hypothetical protein
MGRLDGEGADGGGGDAGLRFGECRLDLDRGTLTRCGALVPVRAKAFALLGHLARNAGRVVSKDELLERVWPGVTVTEDSLTQAIRDLRRAIGDDRQEIVRTIARRGYLLAVPLDPAPARPGGAGEPRVAVLSFRNLTGDAHDGILIDGLVRRSPTASRGSLRLTSTRTTPMPWRRWASC